MLTFPTIGEVYRGLQHVTAMVNYLLVGDHNINHLILYVLSLRYFPKKISMTVQYKRGFRETLYCLLQNSLRRVRAQCFAILINVAK